MIRKPGALSLLTLLGVLLVVAAPALAQRGGHGAPGPGASQQLGQQAAQQQLAQMDRTIERLHRLEQQAGQLAQSMA